MNKTKKFLLMLLALVFLSAIGIAVFLSGYHIIDSRYRSGKPMIITTNLTMHELEHPETREKMRIYDRVLECCTPVRVDGTHIRAIKRGENRIFAREHLK